MVGLGDTNEFFLLNLSRLKKLLTFDFLVSFVFAAFYFTPELNTLTFNFALFNSVIWWRSEVCIEAELGRLNFLSSVKLLAALYIAEVGLFTGVYSS